MCVYIERFTHHRTRIWSRTNVPRAIPKHGCVSVEIHRESCVSVEIRQECSVSVERLTVCHIHQTCTYWSERAEIRSHRSKAEDSKKRRGRKLKINRELRVYAVRMMWKKSRVGKTCESHVASLLSVGPVIPVTTRLLQCLKSIRIPLPSPSKTAYYLFCAHQTKACYKKAAIRSTLR